MTNKTAASQDLAWVDIGYILEGISYAARPLQRATEDVTREFSLGPRGAWMVLIIARGGLYPLDLTGIFDIGRSLVTTELARLNDAGLVVYRRDAEDGRRVELALTALGEKVNQRLKTALSRLVREQLHAYSRDEILLCARMLRDFRRTADAAGTERYEQWSDAQLSALAQEAAREISPRPKQAAAKKPKTRAKSRI